MNVYYVPYYCFGSNYYVAYWGTTLILGLCIHYLFSLSFIFFIVFFYIVIFFCLMEKFSILSGVIYWCRFCSLFCQGYYWYFSTYVFCFCSSKEMILFNISLINYILVCDRDYWVSLDHTWSSGTIPGSILKNILLCLGTFWGAEDLIKVSYLQGKFILLFIELSLYILFNL